MNVWNREAERMSGYSAAEFLGRPVPDAIRDLSGEFGRRVARIKPGEVISNIAARRRRRDGKMLDTLSSAAGLFDANGTLIGMVTVTEDVTEAKTLQTAKDNAEALLRESERKYRSMFDRAPIGINHVAPDGRFLTANPFFCNLLGYTQQELLTMNVYDVTDAEDMPATRLRLERGMAGDAPMGHVLKRFRHRDGHVVWCDMTQAMECDESGAVRTLLSIVNDVTDRKTAEDRQRELSAQLHQAQKMEAIGQLTGGMAHDFNNLLTIIMLNLEFLAQHLTANVDAQDLAQNAMQAALRGAELTRALLAFARRQPLAPTVIDLADTLRASGQLLRRTLGEDLTLVISLQEPLWPVLIDGAQIESAILNLAVNARDAMPGGGTLTLEARNVTLDEGAAELNPEAEAGDFLVISVSDTGAGMPPAVIAKAFDPFFTTKGAQGTGLGLSMVHGFVKQSGGHTRIYSEVGQGTTITIYLPRSRGSAVGQVTQAPAREVVGHHEAILVVEDNDELRRAAVRLLQGLGYQTVAVADGASALQIVRSVVPIDLLFTDVVMAGKIDGVELATSARALRPDLKVLFTSGFTAAALAAASPADLGAMLLSKPYRRDDLARYVRAAIDGGPP
jgi:PAS domain S-box-containing protein